MDEPKRRKKHSALFVLFGFFFIPVMANLVAAMGMDRINTALIPDPGFQKAAAMLARLRFRILLITFIPPVVMIILYFMPIYSGFLALRRGNGFPEIAGRRLLNAPLIVSLIGVLGWMIAMGFAFFFFTGDAVRMETVPALRIPLLQLLNGFLCFVISFYLLDAFSRRWVIPAFFREEDLFRIRGVLQLTLRARFVIMFVAITVFPVFFFFNILYSAFLDQGKEQLIPVLWGAVLILVFLSSMIVRLIADGYRRPLVALRRATESIRKGVLDVHVPVVANDELGHLGMSVNEMAAGLREKEFIKETFGKVVDPSVRDHLLAGNVRLGGELKDVAVLFSDIRSFTGISEQMEPARIVEMLNMYFDVMSGCIIDHGGTVNKYIGDAVMAIFGAPIVLDNPAKSALDAAIDMRRALSELNSSLLRSGFPELAHGIGIHYGTVLAGNIGSSNRMEYTVIGDTVNLASRVEGVTKILGCPLLISDSIRHALPDPGHYSLRELDEVIVKGRNEPVIVYECYDGELPPVRDAKDANHTLFSEALTLYRRERYREAMDLFNRCRDTGSEDAVPGVYEKRCRDVLRL